MVKSKSKSKKSRRMSRSKTDKSGGGSESGFEGEESEDDDNPHYKIIGKQFVKGMKKRKTYIEKLNAERFKAIKFPNSGGFPKFAIDFFKHVCLFDLEEFYFNKRQEEI